MLIERVQGSSQALYGRHVYGYYVDRQRFSEMWWYEVGFHCVMLTSGGA